MVKSADGNSENVTQFLDLDALSPPRWNEEVIYKVRRALVALRTWSLRSECCLGLAILSSARFGEMVYATGTSGLACGRTPVQTSWECLTVGTSGQRQGLF